MPLSICDACCQAADTDTPELHCHNKLLCACQCRHNETKLRTEQAKGVPYDRDRPLDGQDNHVKS